MLRWRTWARPIRSLWTLGWFTLSRYVKFCEESCPRLQTVFVQVNSDGSDQLLAKVLVRNFACGDMSQLLIVQNVSVNMSLDEFDWDTSSSKEVELVPYSVGGKEDVATSSVWHSRDEVFCEEGGSEVRQGVCEEMCPTYV